MAFVAAAWPSAKAKSSQEAGQLCERLARASNPLSERPWLHKARQLAEQGGPGIGWEAYEVSIADIDEVVILWHMLALCADYTFFLKSDFLRKKQPFYK